MIVLVTGATSGIRRLDCSPFRGGRPPHHRRRPPHRTARRAGGRARRRGRADADARRAGPRRGRTRHRRAPAGAGGDRSAGQQRRARARPRAGPARRPRRLGRDGRHQHQGADDDDPRGAAGDGGARSRARRQPRIDGGPLALPGRERLRRDEGVRAPVLAEPAGRSAGDEGAGDGRRSGNGRRHRVLVDPLSRRRHARGEGLRGGGAAACPRTSPRRSTGSPRCRRGSTSTRSS